MKNLFLILLLSAFCLAQTKMYIKKNNNQVDSIPISEISKISFNNNDDSRIILFQENFESGNLNNWQSTSPSPVISSLHYQSPTHALTLPSSRNDYCFIYKKLDDSLFSGTVGVEYKIMKLDSLQPTVFYGLLYKRHSNWPDNFQMYILGGFIQDSIAVATYDEANPNIHVFDKKVRKIVPGRWYKLKLEHNFDTNTGSYYLNDVKVGEYIYQIPYFDYIMFGDHDSDGTDAGNKYFLDDIIVYRKN